jgi:hypothetical protein
VGKQDHTTVVDAWLEDRAEEGRSTAAAVGGLLLDALRAMWSRTRTTLGDVTLAAIFERVLVTARESSPVIAKIKLRVTEDFAIDLDPGAVREVGRDEMRAATRDLIVELLAVLGRLTGETMTPALHAALAAAGDDPTTPPHPNEDRGTR